MHEHHVRLRRNDFIVYRTAVSRLHCRNFCLQIFNLGREYRVSIASDSDERSGMML